MTDLDRATPGKRIRPWVPLGLIVLFAIPLIWPLLRDQMLCSHDGNLHFYRLVALRHAIEQNVLFSRWTPGLVYGYGFPFFNFRELASYYVPELFHLLGFAIPAAVNLVYAAGLILSGWGTYLLARDIWRSELGGLVAALAYMAAPYQLLDVFVRGNLPESMALALMPLIVWLFRRLAEAPGRLTFLAASLSLTGLLLTHNISSLLFLPLLAAYLGVLQFMRFRHGRQPPKIWLVWMAILLGVCLATFSWLPALAEKGSVQLYLTHSTRGNDFHYNFISSPELLAAPAPADPSLLNPPLRVQIGLPQLLAGGLGLLGLLCFKDRERRWHCLLLALATAGLLVLALPVSNRLWEILPLIRFVQFPWRMVGRAALPLALLAGAVPTLLTRRPAAALAFALLAGSAIMVAAQPWLYPQYCTTPDDPTIADVIDFERATGLTGVDPLGAYLPRWVTERPASSPLEDALRQDRTPRRFDASSLPANATLLGESYGPNRATIELSTPDAFQARYYSFYFPGWRVEIDGQGVAIEPEAQTGLITFPVPAGEHTLAIRWTLTPLRIAAAAISLAAALALLAGAGWLAGGGQDPPHSTTRSLGGQVWGLVLLGIGLLLFKTWVVDAGRTPLFQDRLAANRLPELDKPVPTSFDGGLDLIGYRLLPARAGQELVIDLAWTPRTLPAGEYASRIALVDENGLAWSAKETYRPRGFQPPPPTTLWAPGRWAWDSHSVPILAGTPPGNYQIRLTLFEETTLTPLNVLDEAGRIAGPSTIIGEVTIERPERPVDAVPVQRQLDRQWGDLALIGSSLDRSEAAPGDPMLVTLAWQANAPLPARTAQLALLDPAGELLRVWQIPLVTDSYPTTNWRVADALMGQHLVQIPGNAENGLHHWQLIVLDQNGAPQDSPVTLGALSIKAPTRIWTQPETDQSSDVTFWLADGSEIAKLIGFDIIPGQAQPGQTIELTLIWQAKAETETNYRVFVHLLADDGELITQADGIPANWSRPTPGWAAGEYIVDPHTFTIPPDTPAGDYRLAVGLYDLASGDRPAASNDTLTQLAVRSE